MPPRIQIEKVTYADGDEAHHVPPQDDHPINKLNTQYSKDVRMVSAPLQDVSWDDLDRVVGFPLLKPAQKLSERGVKPCDSSPWEDRTLDSFQGDDNGVWAYVAARMDELSPDLQRQLQVVSEGFKSAPYNAEKGRIVARDLPTIFDDKIPGVYFEIRIEPSTKAEDVEKKLLELIEENVPKLRLVIR